MTRIARKSVNELVDGEPLKTVSRENGIQFSILELTHRMYVFLLEIKDKYPCFDNFPTNCCYYSTFFAALVLERLGCDTIHWIFGYRESTGAHVWCECNGFFIDLTSGQYHDSPFEYVMDENNSNTENYHSSFRVINRGVFDNKFRLSKPFFDLLPIVDEFAIQTIASQHHFLPWFPFLD